MEYGLARLVHDSTAFVPISQEEYSAIAEAKEGLFKALFAEEKFDLVVENYLKLETCFLDSTDKNMVLGNQDYEWGQAQRRLFNRRLVNLLSACRSYIDYTKQSIHAALFGTVDAVARIEAAFSSHYDNSFGYRVMEALRNSVQHQGFPIHAVEYPAAWHGEGDDSSLVFGLSIYTKTAYLREDNKFKRAVLKELEDRGGRVDLKLLARDYMAALGDVHGQLRGMIRPAIETWDETVMGAIDRFKTAYPTESLAAGVAAVRRKEQGIEGTVRIFSDFIQYRKSLQRKNGALTNIGKRFVTGEVIRKDAKNDRT